MANVIEMHFNNVSKWETQTSTESTFESTFLPTMVDNPAVSHLDVYINASLQDATAASVWFTFKSIEVGLDGFRPVEFREGRIGKKAFVIKESGRYMVSVEIPRTAEQFKMFVAVDGDVQNSQVKLWISPNSANY